MEKACRGILVLVVSFLGSVVLHAASAPPLNPENSSREEVRTQLSSFVARIGGQSPEGFGALRKSPAMEAAQRRIATLSDEELAEFQQLMAETPDWSKTPESLAKLLPPGLNDRIDAASADISSRIPRAERMREDAGTLLTVLKMLPDAKLKELGIERSSIDTLEQSFRELTPIETTVLQKRLADTTKWDIDGVAAVSALPESLRKGAAALTKHGRITALDIVELEQFRARVLGLLRRTYALPEESKAELKLDSLPMTLDQLEAAQPSTLFVIREQMTPEMLATLDENVSILEKAAKLTPAERRDLEQFRAGMVGMIAGMQETTDSGLRQKLDSLSSADLMMLQSRMPDLSQHQYMLPALYQSLQSPGFAEKIAALKAANPDPAAAASLEDFRKSALAYVSNAGNDASIDRGIIEGAQGRLQRASLAQLELIRSMNERLPANLSVQDRLRVVTNVNIDCTYTIVTPSPLPNINIDLNWLCTPLENAINAVEAGILTTVNSVVNAATAVLNATIAGVNSAVTSVTNTVNSLVTAIEKSVSDILTFVKTIPGAAWDLIKSALNLLLDVELGSPGLTLRVLVKDGLAAAVPKLQTALRLGESWWTALGTAQLPLLPCPAAGIHTPFGVVGDGAAATNYARYKFFIDKIIGLIPDTETSLAIKIPAQILYAAFDYMGVCLQDAANDATETLFTNRHLAVTGAIASLGANSSTQGAQLGGQITASFTTLTGVLNTGVSGINANVTTEASLLRGQLTTSFTALTTLTGQQATSLTGTMNGSKTALETLIGDKWLALNRQIDTETTELTTQIDTKARELTTLITNKTIDLTQLIKEKTTAAADLELRLQIELNLSGSGKPLAAFQLPAANGGYLELARKLVSDALSAMLATGQGATQAQKWLSRADSDIGLRNFKSAYDNLQKCYQELTK